MDFNRRIERFLERVTGNQIFSTMILLFVIIYAGMVKPELPDYVKSLFESPIFRILVLALIGYRANKNPTLALFIAIAFVLTMEYLNRQEVVQKIETVLDYENAYQLMADED